MFLIHPPQEYLKKSLQGSTERSMEGRSRLGVYGKAVSGVGSGDWASKREQASAHAEPRIIVSIIIILDCARDGTGSVLFDELSRRVLFHADRRRPGQNGARSLEFVRRSVYDQHEFVGFDVGLVLYGAILRNA